MRTLLCTLAVVTAASAHAAGSCEARSGSHPPTVVELYTSEGCSSCPPADRWLSSLAGRDGVLALAFHVNYWDRLGWPDRFASAEGTERQRRLQHASGAPYVYTPQVMVDGRDWRGWAGGPRLPSMPATRAPSLKLEREGDTVSASVEAASAPGPGGVASAAAGQLAGYWAVLEDGHASRVRAGENEGRTLQHDHVVRLYRPVPAWPAHEPRRWQLVLPAAAAGQPRRVVFVVTDGTLARPLQALALGC